MKTLFCLALLLLATWLPVAGQAQNPNPSRPEVLFALVTNTAKNGASFCAYEVNRAPNAPGCQKITVSMPPLFTAPDLQYARYQEKNRLTMDNSYNRFNALLPGQYITDIDFTLHLKNAAVKRINKQLQKIKTADTGLAVIINKQVFVIVRAPRKITNNKITFKKKMDILLARHITDSIALARQ